MRNARLDDLQAGIKLGGRNINTRRYMDDNTLWQKEEELKSFWLRVKEESEGAGLKLNMKKKNKTKIMLSGLITAWQIEGAGGRWKQ